MQATEDEVGQELLCPDCYTPVVVPPPSDDPGQKGPAIPHSVDDEYAVRGEKEEEQEERGGGPKEAEKSGKKPSAGDEVFLPVVCHLCETRMYATPAQVGEFMLCPTCDTPAVVPRPETGPATTESDATPIGEYAASERPEGRTGVRPERVEPAGPKPSKVSLDRAFFTRNIGFLWDFGTWPRLVGLMAGLLPGLALVVLAVVLMWGGLAGQFGSAFFMGSGGLACVMWALAACPHMLTVLQDTAEGNDSIEDWPELGVFADWVADFAFLFNSLCVSILIGVAAAYGMGPTGPTVGLLVSISVFALFPIFLLSMLEGNSALRLLSPTVVGSLFTVGWAWAMFYLESAILVAAFVALSALVLHVVGLWGLLPLGILAVPVLMVYFRLLGRVAWCCGEVMRRDEEEPGERGGPGDSGATPTPSEPRATQAPDPPTPTPEEPPVPTPDEPSASTTDGARKKDPSILDDDWEWS
jgi:hypothetical protein